jgi:hypothetical protein
MAGSFLARRISIAIQRGNAASLLGTLPMSIDEEEFTTTKPFIIIIFFYDLLCVSFFFLLAVKDFFYNFN